MRRRPLATTQAEAERPRNWDQWVTAAFLRLLGVTQKDAARAAGVGLRTLCRYEADPRWPQAVLEAQERWLKGLDGQVRRKLLEALSGDPDDRLLMWYAERRFPQLAQPAIQRPAPSIESPAPISVGAVPAGLPWGAW